MEAALSERCFPAIIEGDAATGYSVFFPDLPGCTSGGETIEQAAGDAGDALYNAPPSQDGLEGASDQEIGPRLPARP